MTAGADLFGQSDIIRSATVSLCGKLRWTLSRRWGKGPRVCFIGHNPSKADGRIDDPTVMRWCHFSRAWGYDGFVAVNLYPLRSPSPQDAQRWANFMENGPDWGARDDLDQNRSIVAREAKASALVVACWGAIARDHFWIDEIVEDITSGEEPWPAIHVFGLTAAGHPIHPMARGKHRVRDDAQPVRWRE